LATLNGGISGDPSNTHTLTIAWGDWNNAAVSTFNIPAVSDPSLTVNQTIASSTDGAVLLITKINPLLDGFSFRVQHQYLDEGPAPGGGTAPGTATIQATVNAYFNGNYYGSSVSQSATVTINDATPTAQISGFTQLFSAFILPGDNLVFHGSLTDSGALDTHTAQWTFSDGFSTTTDLGQGGAANFSGGHSFAAPGTYTVTLTVTDDDGSQAQETTTVVVQPPAEVLPILCQQVQGLTELNAGQQNALCASVDAAFASLTKGNDTAATNQLTAFINKLVADVQGHKLASDEADLLICESDDLIRVIGGL
jgi:hypothetical protein